MSQYPPPPPPAYPGAYPMPPGQKSSNGAAITSLICGILGVSCLPGIGSLVAIPFGLVGLSNARRPNTRGKGMAISGLLLGLAGLLLVSGISFFFYRLVQSTTPAIHFVQAMDRGDFATARANSTSNITDEELRQLIATCQSLGKLQDVTRSNVSYSNVNGVARYEVTGAATFAKGTRNFKMVLASEGGAYKVASLKLESTIDVE